MIPYGRQDVSQADIDAVVSVLRSDFLTQGPLVPRFEEAVMRLTGARHAVAVNSATSALHIAALALGLGPGDRLWTVPNTFVASANCARYCGADVDFVDIDPHSWNMSLPALRTKLLQARAAGALPKVVVPVDFGGQPVEQEEIAELAREYGFKVIEDASHAIGATRHGQPVGSCRWADITVFSFHPVKIVTSGEGGMALTNDPALARSMMMLRTHGITRDPALMQAPNPPAWHYEQQLLGFNYRLTDLHAALGLSQLSRLAGFVERRNQLAAQYASLLGGLPLQLPSVSAGNRSAFHLYVVRLDPRRTAQSRRYVFDTLRERGIGVNVHYEPVHLQPYYRRLGFTPGMFPEAERYGATGLTLPLFAAMSDAQQIEVVEALRSCL